MFEQKIRTQMAISAFKRDVPVGIGGCVILSADSPLCEAFDGFCELAESSLRLVLSQKRAENIGLAVVDDGNVALVLAEGISVAEITKITESFDVGEIQKILTDKVVEIVQSDDVGNSAIKLAKISERLPAILIANCDAEVATKVADFPVVTQGDLSKFEVNFANSLQKITEAPLNLRFANDAKIVVFRSYPFEKEHLALIISEADNDSGDDVKTPLVRIHSSCFTGDLLDSLTCDCGSQLHDSIKFMSQNGGGIIVYLMQEGRGIGLTNKLRAYDMKDRGMDTVEANEFLGFDDDERPYENAAKILQELGVSSVRLLTNNPRKVKGLEKCGIEVVERVSLMVEQHEHNESYLKTKFSRLGHLK